MVPFDLELMRETAAEVPAFVKRAPQWLALPSLLLAGGALLDAWLAPVHALAPALISVAKGLGWGSYVLATFRQCGGTDRSTPGLVMVCLVFAFLGLEYGGCAVALPLAFWAAPVIDFSVMYAEPAETSLGCAAQTLKDHPLAWLATMLSLLVLLIMLGLVLELPVSLYATFADRQGAWMAGVVGGLLLGPMVHLAVVYRARLFLALHGDPA